MPKVHPTILEQIKKVTGKRPLAVINHILKHGQVTTEELKNVHGYNHPPRAARDVREQGIPLDTIKVRGTDGRMIAAYVFGDSSKIEHHKLGGRRVFSKAFKELLLERQGLICAITGEPFHPRYLSIDHRMPYEVAGERVSGEDNPSGFMLISAAAQRQKSWSCEHCKNWRASRIERSVSGATGLHQKNTITSPWRTGAGLRLSGWDRKKCLSTNGCLGSASKLVCRQASSSRSY